MATGNDVRAPLEGRLSFLAERFYELAHDEDASAAELKQFLRDHLATLGEFGRQVEEDYVRLSGGREQEEVPTTAQGVALARFLRGHFRRPDPLMRSAHVTRGGGGLSDDYLLVRFHDGECGIDPSGRTST